LGAPVAGTIDGTGERSRRGWPRQREYSARRTGRGATALEVALV